jgi:tetratricopeptide (TPR) repeat protein
MADKKTTGPLSSTGGKPGGRQDVYRQAMQRGHNLAWDQKWEQAVREYQAALAEFPDDPQALSSAGLALFNLKRFPEALAIYQRAARLNLQDTVALEKIADIEERLGHVEEAAKVYVAVAEAHLQKRDLQAAVDNWTRACRLTPSLLGAHQRLALAHERMGKPRLAVREYLAVARIFEQRGETDKAIQVCQKALQLDPHNQDVLTALDLLRSGDHDALGELAPESPEGPRQIDAFTAPPPAATTGPLPPRTTGPLPPRTTGPLPPRTTGPLPTPSTKSPSGEFAAPVEPAAEEPSFTAPVPTQAAEAAFAGIPQEALVNPEQAPEERASPVETARQRALTDLAESLFEESVEVGQGRDILADPTAASQKTVPRLSRAETDTLISQAIDYQTRGNTGAAINKYEQAIAGGVDLPAAHFNLGLLYQQLLRFDEAIAQFELALRDTQYQLGAHFALGECFRARGRIDEAVAHFLEVLRIVDMSTVRHEQADDLIQLYHSLADTFAARGEQEQAVSFLNSLVEFLSSKGWEDKVVQARQRLDDLASEGLTISLAEVLSIPGSDRLLESLALGQEYIRRSLWRTAMEETYRSLQLAPTYLPAHMRMAELLQREGRLDEASAKFLMVAEVYRVRGDVKHTIAVYEQTLKVSPMDLPVRAKTIDLLIRHGEIDRALEHYLLLADAHYQLAQVDKAREKYREALKLAPRGSTEHNWPVQILHHMGDIDMQRLNWRDALTVYEQIRKFAPDDERAVVTLIELYFKLNQEPKAIDEVDYLLKMLKTKGKDAKALAILEDLAKSRPSDMALRARLAQSYSEQGRTADAIEQLDALGELQLDAGLRTEAAATIRAILALRPADPSGYQKLLEQLTV